MAPIAHQVVEAYDRGELQRAFALHEPFRAVARTAQHHGGLGFVKELMNRLGPECGSPRSPWGPLAATDLQAADQLVPDLQTAIEKANSERERP
jgi:N-acetylneuraminate lyase